MTRALWKGTLRIAELACPVALHGAASTAERISLNLVDRASGRRVRRIYVDSVSGREVPREAQVKSHGPDDDYVILDPEAVAATVPESTKVLEVEAFVAEAEVDPLAFDKPYYLLPADRAAAEAYALIRDGLRARSAAALARAVLFRRNRAVLVRAFGDGLLAHTLLFDYELRSAAEAFDGIAAHAIGGEMLDLAKHIISGKTGRFDPAAFTDRYEAALKELIAAKIEGRALPIAKRRAPAPVVDLRRALEESAKAVRAAKSAGKSRKAG